MKRITVLLLACMISNIMFSQDNYWTPVVYADYWALTSAIYIDGEQQTSDQIEVGAFCGDECRGSMRIQHWTMTIPNGPTFENDVAFQQIYGATGDEITFKLYDHSTNKILDLVAPDPISWDDNQSYGAMTPYEIHFTTPTPQPQTFTLDITGYGTTDGNYYLIAPPFDDINPAQVEGMTSGDFDLFYFDQAEALEWRNYGTTPFNLESGKGYLYAHKTTVTLSFTGVPYSGDGKVTLRKTGGLDFEGWNLVGNPFATAASLDRPFYVMNTAGTEIITATGTGVNAMQGIFVIANSDNEQIQFTQSGSGSKEQIVLNVLQDRGNTIDRAIVRFNENSTLPKFMLNDSNTKLYIPQEDDDYAVVNSNGANSMPVNFKAMANGTYTLSVDINLDMEYLHLIDNKTGADIDLLVQPDYQFAADKNDNEARFMLVFRSTTGIEENGQQNFSFVKDSHLYFNEEVQNAELCLVDITGRLVRQMTLKGNSCDLSGINEGLYIVRLAKDNDVKIQKVFVR